MRTWAWADVPAHPAQTRKARRVHTHVSRIVLRIVRSIVTWREGANAGVTSSCRILRARHIPRALPTRTHREITDRPDIGRASASRNIGHDLPMVKKSSASCRMTRQQNRHRPVTLILLQRFFAMYRWQATRVDHAIRCVGPILGPVSSGLQRIVCSRWHTVNQRTDAQRRLRLPGPKLAK